MRYKYPRTVHLPWSPGVSSDDIRIFDMSHFEGHEIVVTEKMDGENTSIYNDGLHARSTDSRHHLSRDWVKALQGQISFEIPQNWRLCGENLYAVHSLAYASLKSYFYLFAIYNDANICLSWDETEEWAELLGLVTAPVLYRGLWDESVLRSLEVNTDEMEGYVVRRADAFHYDDFQKNLAKWVRTGHVQTDQHWMHKAVEPNKLAGDADV